jgi:hypothetical protein
LEPLLPPINDIALCDCQPGKVEAISFFGLGDEPKYLVFTGINPYTTINNYRSPIFMAMKHRKK